MNFLNNLFKTTEGLVEETLKGLKSLSEVYDIETKKQSNQLNILEKGFNAVIKTAEEIEEKLNTATEQATAKERVDILTREKKGAEIVRKYIENNQSFLKIIQNVDKYKADLFKKNSKLKEEYYKKKYNNTLNDNKSESGSNLDRKDMLGSNETSARNSNNHAEALPETTEITNNQSIEEPDNDFDGKIKELRSKLAPDTETQPSTSKNIPKNPNLGKLLDIDKDVYDLISSLKSVGTVNHKQCQEYLNLITAASNSICDEVKKKNDLEMNITIAEYLQKNKTKYTTADASGDFYKNFLYNLDNQINNRNGEQQKAIRDQKIEKYNELAKKIEKNIKKISDFFDKEDNKNLPPKEYEKKINQLTRDMQKSVLDLNREIKRLNIGPVTMGNNSKIAKYNTLDVAMNECLNKKIEDGKLNEEITKALSDLEKGKTNKETQIIKEIDDLISEIDKFRANTFDKTTQNDNGNIYNNLQKKIETAINQNTQNYSFCQNATQILNGSVKTKINELKESNHKLNSSLNFIAKENEKAEIVKKNLLQRRSSGVTSL